MEVVHGSILELMNEELVGSWKRHAMSLVGHCLSAYQSFGLMGLRHPSACTMRLLLNKKGNVRVGFNPNKSKMENGLSGGFEITISPVVFTGRLVSLTRRPAHTACRRVVMQSPLSSSWA
jgi:hypothetical protein